MYRILYALVGVSVAIDVLLGAWASMSWASFGRFWFLDPAIATSEGTKLVGLVLGLALLFYAVLQAFAVRRIRSDDETGYSILIGFGGYLLVSAIVTFAVAQSIGGILKFGGIEFLLVDGLRGALLATFAVLAMREPATVRELKLPSPNERAKIRAPRERGEERRRPSRRPSSDSSRGGQRRRSSASRGAGDRGGRGGRRRRRPSGGRDGDRGTSAPAA